MEVSMERRSKPRRRRGRGLLFLLALTVLAGLYVWWGNTALQTEAFSPSFRDLPPGFDGCRVVVLGDLHSTFFGEKNKPLLEAVEAQDEDTVRDCECYVDADGNTYDFAFGLNWSGVINDERVQTYSVDPLTECENLDFFYAN